MKKAVFEQFPFYSILSQILSTFFVTLLTMFQRLVGTCGEVQAAPTEIEEIQFLCTVCAKIKADPYLVNFFLEVIN